MVVLNIREQSIVFIQQFCELIFIFAKEEVVVKCRIGKCVAAETVPDGIKVFIRTEVLTAYFDQGITVGLKKTYGSQRDQPVGVLKIGINC